MKHVDGLYVAIGKNIQFYIKGHPIDFYRVRQLTGSDPQKYAKWLTTKPSFGQTYDGRPLYKSTL